MWANRVFVLVILAIFLCNSVIAVDFAQPISSSGGNAIQSSIPSEIIAQLDQLTKGNLEELKKYNDENFMAFDTRINGYMQQQQMKIIIAAIGVNMLVAGLMYFYLIRNNRDLSYESISLKRKKEIDDRNFMADSINQMRDRYEQLEEYLKTQIQPSLYSLEQLAQQRRFADDGSIRTGGQAFQQGQPGHGGGSQGYAPDVSMANQGYVQEPVQVQGQYSYGDQYEQPPSGPGWYGGAYQ